MISQKMFGEVAIVAILAICMSHCGVTQVGNPTSRGGEQTEEQDPKTVAGIDRRLDLARHKVGRATDRVKKNISDSIADPGLQALGLVEEFDRLQNEIGETYEKLCPFLPPDIEDFEQELRNSEESNPDYLEKEFEDKITAAETMHMACVDANATFFSTIEVINGKAHEACIFQGSSTGDDNIDPESAEILQSQMNEITALEEQIHHLHLELDALYLEVEADPSGETYSALYEQITDKQRQIDQLHEQLNALVNAQAGEGVQEVTEQLSNSESCQQALKEGFDFLANYTQEVGP